MTVHEDIRNMRLDKALRLKDVARSTGLSVSYLCDIEHGRAEPSLTTLQKLADCYGLKLEIAFRRPTLYDVLQDANQ